MNIPEAVRILQALVAGDADCRCGNFNIDEVTTEALKVVIDALEDIELKDEPT